MKMMLRVWLAAVAASLMLVASAGIASAHNVHVTPDGGGTCQFLGGPGNPGHAGHSHGHVVALSSERSDVVAISFTACP